MRLAMAASLALCALMFGAVRASAVAPIITGTAVSGATSSSAILEASVNPNGKATRYRFEYGPADCASSPCTAIPVPEGELSAGSSSVTVKAKAEGLTPGTLYHFRVVARNGTAPADKVEGPDRIFATISTPISGLPDNRAYEQASPIDKDGGDAIGIVPQIKAAPAGGAITFSSTVGMPGGEGAQEFPIYLSSRSNSGWSTRGLFPPASAGQEALIVGWLPGFTQVFSSATKLGDPSTGAFLARPGMGGPLEELTPYLPKADYTYVGASADGSLVVFETRASLGSPAGTEGVSNVYAWDRSSGEVSLVSVDNEEQPLSNGAFGGSYDWALGMTPTNLSQGGSARNYYTQDQHAVSEDGAVFFTETGTGQLYMRVNPTQPQSAMDAGKCSEPDKACTLHVSESQRTPPDPGGSRPAAFMGAASDGSAAFFTSPEKLTDDANTGPIQPQPNIGRADIDGVTDIEPEWLANHRAVGVAVDSEFIYWANPAEGTIGRAELDGDTPPDDEFIVPEPTTVEEEIEIGTDEFETVTLELPSKPRYVAVDAGHIYWTNTADGENEHGTIGRADIDGTPESVEPECITGASNPQGIAVNATHIYWANRRSIGRAELDCEGAVPDLQRMKFEFAEAPYGVALSGSKVYWVTEEGSGISNVNRAPLAGGAGFEEIEQFFLGTTAEPRGLALAGDNLYWAAQGEKAIGHAVWPDAQPSPTTVEKELIELDDGAPSGVAVDSEHIYWSTDGETLPSTGNDLYRFVPDGKGGGDLSDLTPEPLTENGAEVQGVVAVSGDGSRVYFSANADLDGTGPAQAGDCVSPLRSAKDKCSLYLWNAGETSFIARLDATGSSLQSDAVNWAPTTSGIAGGSEFQKTAFLSADGQTLLFRSQEQLTAYDNEGVSQLYRFREGEPIHCVSCPPSGEPAKSVPTMGTIKPSALRGVAPASLASRNLSADGNRVFFETSEALVSTDTNGQGSCPPVGSDLQKFPACLDVYEWEAPGSGSCKEASAAFSPLNEGCIYLISTGKDDYPSLFADASESGNDVFFFTRQGLVGQDKDELLDVYDARVGGGLASQNPPPKPICESAESCHGPIPAAPAEGAPTSQTFVGPGNAVAKPKPHKKQRKHKKHRKHKKKHAKKTKKKQKQKQRAQRAKAERRANR